MIEAYKWFRVEIHGRIDDWQRVISATGRGRDAADAAELARLDGHPVLPLEME